ncbi:zinc knuckle (CCHC-type) family protein [Striga hermonthica]|uniref:Zinc knuckle (CCHC-type) family protein n=1 Tax=Striga hermonthica TaxID=68872 RepID=A0A9N7MCC4_STRHE|nr:zinc knuckle (CCHC-type) family protein [Striga hermonthica]
MSCSSRRSQNSQNSGASNASIRKLCHHSEDAIVLTSMTNDNPCRRFYRCPNRGNKPCRFFEWIDQSLPAFQRTCFIRLKAEKHDLEEKLRDMEKFHNHRSSLKEDVEGDKNSEMILVLEKTITQVKNLERKMSVFMVSLIVVVLVLVVWYLSQLTFDLFLSQLTHSSDLFLSQRNHSFALYLLAEVDPLWCPLLEPLL